MKRRALLFVSWIISFVVVTAIFVAAGRERERAINECVARGGEPWQNRHRSDVVCFAKGVLK